MPAQDGVVDQKEAVPRDTFITPTVATIAADDKELANNLQALMDSLSTIGQEKGIVVASEVRDMFARLVAPDEPAGKPVPQVHRRNVQRNCCDVAETVREEVYPAAKEVRFQLLSSQCRPAPSMRFGLPGPLWKKV